MKRAIVLICVVIVILTTITACEVYSRFINAPPDTTCRRMSKEAAINLVVEGAQTTSGRREDLQNSDKLDFDAEMNIVHLYKNGKLTVSAIIDDDCYVIWSPAD